MKMEPLKMDIKVKEPEEVKETCCCGLIDVHTGTLIIAVLTIILSVLHMCDSVIEIGGSPHSVILIIEWISAFLYVTDLVVTVPLIYGNLKKTHLFYIPYLFYTWILNMILLVFTFAFFFLFIGSFLFSYERNLKRLGYQVADTDIALFLLAAFGVLFIVTCVSIYFWKVVIRSWELLKGSNTSLIV